MTKFLLEDLMTPAELAKAFPTILTKGTLQWQLRHRHENGLASACVQIGKKTAISKTRYETWLATRSGL